MVTDDDLWRLGALSVEKMGRGVIVPCKDDTEFLNTRNRLYRYRRKMETETGEPWFRHVVLIRHPKGVQFAADDQVERIGGSPEVLLPDGTQISVEDATMKYLDT